MGFDFISLSNGGNNVSLHKVVIGEVWLFSGKGVRNQFEKYTFLKMSLVFSHHVKVEFLKIIK